MKREIINKNQTFIRSLGICALYRLQQLRFKETKGFRGSIVVEAAVALPIFLLAVSHMIYWMSFLEVDRNLATSVNERVRKLAVESFAGEEEEKWVEAQKGETLRGRYFLRIAKARAFTGRYYDDSVMNSEESRLVFVTKNGSVFHRSLVCSHIKPTIRLVMREEVGNKRNKKGEKYYACEFCGKKKMNRAYITEYGNRFHSEKNCKGLRRTIRIVTLKNAREEGYGRCKKCGNHDD